MQFYIEYVWKAFYIFNWQATSDKIRATKTQVLIVSGQKNMLQERMKLQSELWSSDIAVNPIFLKRVII